MKGLHMNTAKQTYKKYAIYMLVLLYMVVLSFNVYSDTAPATPAEMLPVERYALYVASNNGGEGREMLKYAGTDAVKLAETMNEIGGIRSEHSMILTDPTKADIEDAFTTFKKTIEKNQGKAKRTEFLFYYSGHSDETEFLLGNESYSYSALKAALNAVPSDVHVVMLDSCYSGNFVRAKGGSRQKPFLLDDSSVVQGHAYLSSSSEHEASQESDTIRASYFTHALIAGLRGAADTSGDNKVSLNELYHYAFNETLSQTELSSVGPQHPSYNITLVGSGDLVLTDISDAECLLIIPAEYEGKYFIRDLNGVLISEVSKINGTAISLALSEGNYSVAVVTQTSTSQGNIKLSRGDHLTLDGGSLSAVARTPGRARGVSVIPGTENDETTAPEDETSTQGNKELSAEEELMEAANRLRQQALEVVNADKNENESSNKTEGNDTPLNPLSGFPPDSELEPFVVCLIPGISFPSDIQNAKISIGVFSSKNGYIKGIQANGFMGTITGGLFGIQGSGFMNTTTGSITGIQCAGFMNIANGFFSGVQGAGFMNIAKNTLTGIQGAGFMNIARSDVNGVQGSSFLNITAGDFKGIQGASFLNITTGNFNGLQTSGFLNIATDELKGTQASGFLNIANNVHGLQVGIINIAKKNDGVSLGILNFISDGIMSPALYTDSDSNFCIQYQGGTPNFYTTFLAGINTDRYTEWDIGNVFCGFGIGTRVRAEDFVSFDFEILNKAVFDMRDMADFIGLLYDADLSNESTVTFNNETIDLTDSSAMNSQWEKIGNALCIGQVPSLRITANFAFDKHFSLFCAYNLDANISRFNDGVFEQGHHGESITVTEDRFYLYPSWSFGIKF